MAYGPLNTPDRQQFTFYRRLTFSFGTAPPDTR
jgi:hypothetical protein